jgi:5-formyltetrahydrofolate cyclo-ligase
VEIVTIFQQKINEIIQIVLSLKNIAQEIKNLQHTAKQNKTAGSSCCFFCIQKNLKRSLTMDKKQLRTKLKETLSTLSKPLYEELSKKIASQLFQEEDWQKSTVIGITISKFPEVDTYQIIRKAWQEGKTVAVPKCYPKEKRMDFRVISDFSQLESVFYGLSEPIEDKTSRLNSENIDLIIVPGLGYTKEGYRIGFGGGYYDRYLKDYTGKTISLAFQSQILPSFTNEDHDIPVAKIITNDEVILVK